MKYDTFEKLKFFAVNHPDKIQTITKKELDNMALNEMEGNKHGRTYAYNTIRTCDTSMPF